VKTESLLPKKKFTKGSNMAKQKEPVSREQAEEVAKMIGCSGVHQDENGNWLPCSSPESLSRVSNRAETGKWTEKVMAFQKKRKRKKRSDGWEELGEKPIRGITGLPGVGIVSAVSGEAGMAAKTARSGPEYVRENDPDVFIDPESARVRSRQLGCIGISRRVSKNGRAVWMPCTNMSDYARVSGTTSLGRRGRREESRRDIQKVVREELNRQKKK
jgi:hypothetical protein